MRAHSVAPTVPFEVEGPASTTQDPSVVAGRYRVLALLGRGGMASVYRVHDSVHGCEVALKRLDCDAADPKTARLRDHFEREFHTLMQLSHPRVVQALDYGVDADRPYYTMELLDGGDIRELAPLPFERVCSVAYDIASALALLHSRRLVHRDITPRNLRCTSDGRTKLIDFGLLSPIGPVGMLAGTPPYVAPELVQSMTLDARSDLFSLGATLYFALTGRLAFPAKRFEQLRDLWRSNPLPPSSIVSGIPPELDALVLALLRVDVGSRPKSAAEVMERLRPLLPSPPDDELRVGRSFLVTPQLVGRDDLVLELRKQVVRTMRRRGGGFLIEAEPGSGRSRVLDAFVLEAKLVGATTLRTSAADSARGAFGAAAALAEQLIGSAPELSRTAACTHPAAYRVLFGASTENGAAQPTPGPLQGDDVAEPTLLDLTSAALDRSEVLEALRAWLLAFSEKRPLAIAVDDLEGVDEPSVALLASLCADAATHRVLYAVTAERGAAATAPEALEVLRQHSTTLPLTPLIEEQTLDLLRSLFGDAPHLQQLAAQLHVLSEGRPRECMVLAQHLVDRDVIRFDAGAWALPGVIAPNLLPTSVQAAHRAALERLSPLARRIGAVLALGVRQRLSREQLMPLVNGDSAALDAALDAALAHQVISGSPTGYAPRNGEIARRLCELTDGPEQLAAHAYLARTYAEGEEDPIAIAHHMLLGPKPVSGLDFIIARATDSAARTKLSTEASSRLGAGQVVRTLELALAEATRQARPRKEHQALWVMLAGMSAQGEDTAIFYRLPATWLEQLKLDSGHHDFYHSVDPAMEPVLRIMHAYGKANERYTRAPEHERVQAPSDAIKQLVGYAVFSIAVSSRVLDIELQTTLPGLLAPFAPLTPLLAAMHDNTRGTLQHGQGMREAARDTFASVLRQLDAITDGDLAYLDRIRGSLHQTVALISASLGVQDGYEDALAFAASDPHQQVGALYVRKIAALHAGDWEAAERYRRKAERLALQCKANSMFSTLGQELEAHALARDLTGLRQVRAAIHAMAEQHRGWRVVAHVADAHYHHLCADHEGALAAARRARTCAECDPRSPWVSAAITVEIEALRALARLDEAWCVGAPELSRCEQDARHYLARNLACALALVEAERGDPQAALDRLERVIHELRALGATGLLLGRAYELCARVAIGTRDAAAFQRYASYATAQYRPGESSVLGALYERLLEDARAAGVIDGHVTLDFDRSDRSQTTGATGHVTSILTGCSDAGERAQRVLALLCHAGTPRRGFLFLLGDGGLTLRASNALCRDPNALDDFAKQYLQLELADDAQTLTSADVAAMLNTGIASGHFIDSDNARYRAQLLACRVDGSLLVAGLSVLNAQDDATMMPAQQRISHEVARHLIEAGDVNPARAA